MKPVAGRDFLSHKKLRRPITAAPKNNGDVLIMGMSRVSNWLIILVIDMGGVISAGMIKVQKNICSHEPVIKQKIKKIANGIKYPNVKKHNTSSQDLLLR